MPQIVKDRWPVFYNNTVTKRKRKFGKQLPALSMTAYYAYIGPLITIPFTKHFYPISCLRKNTMIRLVAALVCNLLYFHSFFSQVKDTQQPTCRQFHSPPDRCNPSIRRTDSVHHQTDQRFIAGQDSIHHRFDRLQNNDIFRFFRGAISHGTPDSAAQAAALNTKSESPFKPYEGKVIRHIYIKGYGFEQTFSDTSKRLQYFRYQKC